MALPCLFNWQAIIDEQLHSFDGNRATVIEIRNNQTDSGDYIRAEIARRGIGGNTRFFSVIDEDSEDYAVQLKDGEVSFCFIDGLHSYTRTKAHLEAWYPKVHFNSAIAGHGIRMPAVRKAVEEFAAEKKVKWRIINECFQINHCHTPGQIA